MLYRSPLFISSSPLARVIIHRITVEIRFTSLFDPSCGYGVDSPRLFPEFTHGQSALVTSFDSSVDTSRSVLQATFIVNIDLSLPLGAVQFRGPPVRLFPSLFFVAVMFSSQLVCLPDKFDRTMSGRGLKGFSFVAVPLLSLPTRKNFSPFKSLNDGVVFSAVAFVVHVTASPFPPNF